MEAYLELTSKRRMRMIDGHGDAQVGVSSIPQGSPRTHEWAPDTEREADIFVSGRGTQAVVGRPGDGGGGAAARGVFGPAGRGIIGPAGRGVIGPAGSRRGGPDPGDHGFPPGGLGKFDEEQDNWVVWLAKKLATEVAAFAQSPCTPEESSRINLIAETILKRMKTVVGTPPSEARSKTEEVMKSIADCVAMWIDESLGEEKPVYTTSLTGEPRGSLAEIKEKDESKPIETKTEAKEKEQQKSAPKADEKREKEEGKEVVKKSSATEQPIVKAHEEKKTEDIKTTPTEKVKKPKQDGDKLTEEETSKVPKKGGKKGGKGKKDTGKKEKQVKEKTKKKLAKETKGVKGGKKGKKTKKTKKLPPVDELPKPEFDISTLVEEIEPLPVLEPKPEPEPEPEPVLQPQLPPDYAYQVNLVGDDLFYISKVDLNYKQPQRTESDILREENELVEEARRKHELKLLKEEQVREAEKEFDEYVRNLNKSPETIKFSKMLKHVRNFMMDTPDGMPKPETLTGKLHLTLHEKFLKLLEAGCPCPDSLDDLRIIARNVSNQVAVWIEKVMSDSQVLTNDKLDEHFEKCLQTQEVKTDGDVRKPVMPVDDDKGKKEIQVIEKSPTDGGDQGISGQLDKEQADEGNVGGIESVKLSEAVGDISAINEGDKADKIEAEKSPDGDKADKTEAKKSPEEVIDETQGENPPDSTETAYGFANAEQDENAVENANAEQDETPAENANVEQDETPAENAVENINAEPDETPVENTNVEQDETPTENAVENANAEDETPSKNADENANAGQDDIPAENTNAEQNETPAENANPGQYDTPAENANPGQDDTPTENANPGQDDTPAENANPGQDDTPPKNADENANPGQDETLAENANAGQDETPPKNADENANPGQDETLAENANAEQDETSPKNADENANPGHDDTPPRNADENANAEQDETPAENANAEQDETSPKNADENANVEQDETPAKIADENANAEQDETPAKIADENANAEQDETPAKIADENANAEHDETLAKIADENADAEPSGQVGGEANVQEQVSPEEPEAYVVEVKEPDADTPTKDTTKDDAELRQPKEEKVHMEEWTQWLLETLTVAEELASFMGSTIAQTEKLASKKKGLVISPDGKVETLSRKEWKEFQAETAKNIKEWRRRLKEIMEEAKKWNVKK